MKKILKNTLYFVLVVSVLIGLTGCGDKKKNESNTNKNSDTNYINDYVSGNNNEISTSENNNENSTSGNIEKGTWNGDTYTNNFIGLKFTLPTNWKASSDEEIAAMMNLGTEIVKDDIKYAEEIIKLTSVYFVIARDSSGNNIIIMAEKPIISVTLDEYMEALKGQLLMISSLKYSVENEATGNLGNKTCKTMTVKETSSGLDQKYYTYKQGDYYISVIMTSKKGTAFFAELEKSFK